MFMLSFQATKAAKESSSSEEDDSDDESSDEEDVKKAPAKTKKPVCYLDMLTWNIFLPFNVWF